MAAKRTFTCPDHGSIDEDTSERDANGHFVGFHCCTKVGHRCGWDLDPEDKGGCHRRLLQPPLTAEQQEAKANPNAAREAALAYARSKTVTVTGPQTAAGNEPLPHERSAEVTGDGSGEPLPPIDAEEAELMNAPMGPGWISKGDYDAEHRIGIVFRPDELVLRRDELAELLNDVDDAIEHAYHAREENHPEGSRCPILMAQNRIEHFRDKGVLPRNTRRRRLLATCTPSDASSAREFIEVVMPGMQARFPDCWVWTHASGTVEVWTRSPG